MFNPSPRIECLPITPRQACWVIDDALLDPQAWIEQAAAEAGAFREAAHNAFPGPERALPTTLSNALATFFDAHLRNRLGARRTVRMHARFSLVARAPHTLAPTQRIPHVDRLALEPGQRAFASVLYLFDDPALGGTAFYRPLRPPAEMIGLLRDSAQLDGDAFTARHGIGAGYPGPSEWFDRVLAVPARYNRLIAYDGTVFHAGQIDSPLRLSADPRQGRLTVNGFFVCRMPAAA
ncbi:DUF6445 family protein [Lysobacter korlensis]|uniref:DUF6445 family protein n=1 Tax=Lysobacter korlensis TaxID=553636 RepID=A0ABV6RHN7_9GAMM